MNNQCISNNKKTKLLNFNLNFIFKYGTTIIYMLTRQSNSCCQIYGRIHSCSPCPQKNVHNFSLE